MTQAFDEDGRAYAVTVIQAGPNYVTQVKTENGDGYRALQLGFGETSEKHVTRPVLGHLAKAGVGPVRRLAEFAVAEGATFEAGQTLSPADVLAPVLHFSPELNEEDREDLVQALGADPGGAKHGI